MKINNETKVGILTVVALTTLILGFNFLKGSDILNRSKKIYAIFSNTGTLVKSNEVKINGFTIGSVYDMEAVDKNVSGIKVTIKLTKDVNIPSNSTAYISAPLAGLGSSILLIEKGDATTYLNDGDLLQTRVDEGVLGGLSSEVTPTIIKLRASLDSLNKVFGNINRMLDSDTKGNIRQTIANLNGATASLNKMLDQQNGALANTLRNVSSVTDNLKKNNDSINLIISNTKRFSEKMSALDLKKTMDTLESAVSQLKATLNQISSPNGTLGALIYDKKLYNKLNDVVLSMEILLDDIRAHPKRYVNFSVFGKKDKGGALDSPSTKNDKPQ